MGTMIAERFGAGVTEPAGRCCPSGRFEPLEGGGKRLDENGAAAGVCASICVCEVLARLACVLLSSLLLVLLLARWVSAAPPSLSYSSFTPLHGSKASFRC